MSKVAITGNASGTGVFTVASPNSNVDRVLTLPDESGTVDTLQRSGNVLQVVNFQTGAMATGTTITPWDDTIPQITEGNEYMTLAITPTNANNILIVAVEANAAGNIAQWMSASLFRGAGVNALSVMNSRLGGDIPYMFSFTHHAIAGSTSATTFKVRIGGDLAGTTTFNGSGGVAKYGGRLASSITITEITP